MPKGASDIPALRLVTLNKLIEKFPKLPGTFFLDLFPTDQAASDTIEWETMNGTMGLTPFVAPGSKAPVMAPQGIAQHSAKCAFMKEKFYLDEEVMNNLRKPGTRQEYWSAEKRIARETLRLRNRCTRRREWMVAKMCVDGSFDYEAKGGTKISVDYGLLSANQVQLTSDYHWDTGTSKNIVSDFFDMKALLRDNGNVNGNITVFNSELLKLMVLDSSLQALLAKSAFGSGDLFANPMHVLSTLFGVGPMFLYDEKYRVEARLTADIAVSGTSISVDNAADFVNGVAYLVNTETEVETQVTISSLNRTAGTATITAATAAYKAGRDKIYQKRKYIPDNKIVHMSDTGPDGIKIAEFMEAPYGNDRRWGMYVDKKEEWDPEGLWVRVQDKGMPVLYNSDTIVQYTVHDSPGQ